MPPENAATTAVASWFADARFGMFVHWGHGSQQGLRALVAARRRRAEPAPLPGRARRRLSRERDATFAPQAAAARASGSRTPAAAGMRYAVLTTQAPRRLRAVRPPSTSRLLDRARAVRRRPRPRVRRRDARRRASASASTSRSRDWHHPDYPRVHRRRPALPLRHVAAARRDEQWAALPRLPVRAQLRELLTQLRHDRRALVRRRLGAHRPTRGARASSRR